jgi:isoprenylcysteine carboxyl methyltransferase (ICMT) family protein YpbQ
VILGESVGEGELSTLIAATGSCGFGEDGYQTLRLVWSASLLFCVVELVLGLGFATGVD